MDRYVYAACGRKLKEAIALHVRRGGGVADMTVLLGISKHTILRRIRDIADDVRRPVVDPGGVYEIDELCTYIGRRDRKIWITYAICRSTRAVVHFVVGNRAADTIRPVTEAVLRLRPSRVCTDRFASYPELLKTCVHDTRLRETNRIERKHLDLRTHLRRLNLKTICYSKSLAVLMACLKIYFWS